MADKVVVVTGGSRGIGAATCLLSAEHGYAVVVNYAARADAAEDVVAAILEKGGKAVAVRGDVSQTEDVDHVFRAADRLGRLAGLVNNAGIVDQAARGDEMSAERLARMFAVNVTASFLCAGAAIRRMSTKYGGLGGAIVNVASTGSKIGSPGQYVDYAATKGGDRHVHAGTCPGGGGRRHSRQCRAAGNYRHGDSRFGRAIPSGWRGSVRACRWDAREPLKKSPPRSSCFCRRSRPTQPDRS